MSLVPGWLIQNSVIGCSAVMAVGQKLFQVKIFNQELKQEWNQLLSALGSFYLPSGATGIKSGG
jgi:hypothetical protein